MDAAILGGLQMLVGAGQSVAGLAANLAAERATGQNIDTLSLQIRDAYLRAGREKDLLLRKAAELKSRQISAYAASGVLVGAGSPVDVLAGTTAQAQEGAAMIQENARREASAYYQSQKNLSLEQRSRNRLTAWNAASSTLSGIGGGYDTYLRLK